MNPTPYKPVLTPDFLVRSLHLKIQSLQRPHFNFTFVTSDSRKVQPGCLFVALPGEKQDGHNFIENAISKGARGVLCKRGFPLPSYKEIYFFPVEDPLSAYRRLAGAWRREFSIPLVAVAGSAGKTTTKELLAALLQGKWSNVLKTTGSQNGFIGIPMTLLELQQEHEAAVVEVGIDAVGAMQQHMNLIGANAAVLTAIGPEHLENLHDIPTVAREEGFALSHVAHSGGIVAINLDDPWIRPHLATLREGRKIPYSLTGATASIDMVSGKLSPDKKSLIFQGLGIPETQIDLPLLGNHNASNLLSAITVAAGLGLTAEEMIRGLKTFKGATGRSEIYEFAGNTRILCDYYNSQPASVNAGLDLLSEVSQNRNRWACLGDMLDLGPNEEFFHRDLAGKILDLQIENVLLYGPRMSHLLNELEKRHFQGYVAHFDTHSDLASTLIQKMKSGDTVLIKGSRGMRMEEVWKILELHAKSHWNESKESGHSSSHS